jgi:hypothetical protein
LQREVKERSKRGQREVILPKLDDWVHVVVGEEPRKMLQLMLIPFTTDCSGN